MKKKLLLAEMVSSVLLTVAVSVSHAAPTIVSDAELDSVSGKANSFISGGATGINLALTGNNQSGNAQLGTYQWFDSHTLDTSQGKGGNRFDGAQSKVQSQVTALNNSIFWGALGQNAMNVGTHAGGSNVAHAIMVVGGF